MMELGVLGSIQRTRSAFVRMSCVLLLAATGSSLQAYTIGGTLTGLPSGQQVTLIDNGSDALILNANGEFSFAASVPAGGTFAVVVSVQPYLEQCTVENGSGTASSVNLTNITVGCAPSPLSGVQSFEHVIGARAGNISPVAVANSPSQLLIAGGFGTNMGSQFSRNNIDPVHNKLVLGYVDVSEAGPGTTPQFFVNGTIPTWFGYGDAQFQFWQVQYWNAAWEPVIYTEIDNVIAQGYDGIFLDAAYGDYDWSPNNVFGNPVYVDATPAMAKLLSDVIAYVKSKNLSKFYLIASNPYGVAESNPSALNGLDGFFFDGLYYAVGTVDVYNGYSAQQFASVAGIYDATGLPVFGVDYPPTGNTAADLQAFAYFTSRGWIPSVNPESQSPAVLTTGPFEFMATPSNPVVAGAPAFVNFLSGGLVAAATLIGGGQGDYFIGGPGTNTIKGGAGNDVIYAHPANAALEGILDIQLSAIDKNSTPPDVTVIVNGTVAVSQLPVTADQTQWQTQDLQIDLSKYGAVTSLEIEAENMSYVNANMFNSLYLESISLNAAAIPISLGLRSPDTLPEFNGEQMWLNYAGTVSFSGAALQAKSPLLSSTGDMIDGGGGTNTVVYNGPYSNYYVVKRSDGSILVTSRATAEGPDQLTNVQALQFSDQTIATASISEVPPPAITAVLNGADFASEDLSAGAWISILGQNLGQAATAATAGATMLGGASVSVCGLAAVLSYNSGSVASNGTTAWQLNALLPDGIAGQTSCPVVVSVDGQASQPVGVTVTSGILEIFQFTSSAGPLPIITHADYSLVGPASASLIPAKPNEAVIAWATGDCVTPAVSVGGASSAVAFSGRVGPGLCQINFVVPNDPTGSNQLRMSTSPNTYNLWISQ